MSDFENETASRIRKKLAMEEMNKEEAPKKEEIGVENAEMAEEDVFAIDKSQYELESIEQSNEDVKSEVTEINNAPESVVADIDKEVKKGNILSNVFGITKPKTEHFKRREGVRPLSVMVGILSLIVCMGIIAVSLLASWKIAVPFWGVIVSMSATFFNETVFIFSLGLGWLLGALVIFLIAAFGLMLIFFFVLLSVVTIGIPIVAFSTCKQPKQVFAYNKDASGNMIFSYILGSLITLGGFVIYMDGSFSPLIYISTLVAGVVFLVVAILLTIDIVQCKKYFRNYDNEKEKQEIIQEAKDVKTAKREKKRRRKALGKLFSMLSRK